MGNVVIKVPYFQSPNNVFDLNITVYDDRIKQTRYLSAIEKLAYLYLCRCSNNSSAYPSYQTIADKCSISKRTAVNAIKVLTDNNIIEKTVRILENGDNKSNIYSLNNLSDLTQNATSIVPNAPASIVHNAPAIVTDATNKELSNKELDIGNLKLSKDSLESETENNSPPSFSNLPTKENSSLSNPPNLPEVNSPCLGTTTDPVQSSRDDKPTRKWKKSRREIAEERISLAKQTGDWSKVGPQNLSYYFNSKFQETFGVPDAEFDYNSGYPATIMKRFLQAHDVSIDNACRVIDKLFETFSTPGFGYGMPNRPYLNITCLGNSRLMTQLLTGKAWGDWNRPQSNKKEGFGNYGPGFTRDGIPLDEIEKSKKRQTGKLTGIIF